MHALSNERTEFLIKDRLSFMRVLGLGLADSVSHATIWRFREMLKTAEAIDALFRLFDKAPRSEGFLAMSGQIVDPTIVGARQRNTIAEKTAIKEGQVADEAHAHRQCSEVERPQRRRARVRASEGSDGSHRAQDRHRARQGDNRYREPGLQHAPLRLAQGEIRRRWF
jgi:hypothetical protein